MSTVTKKSKKEREILNFSKGQTQPFLFWANAVRGWSHTIPWLKYHLCDGEPSIYSTCLNFSTELQIHISIPLLQYLKGINKTKICLDDAPNLPSPPHSFTSVNHIALSLSGTVFFPSCSLIVVYQLYQEMCPKFIHFSLSAFWLYP